MDWFEQRRGLTEIVEREPNDDSTGQPVEIPVVVNGRITWVIDAFLVTFGSFLLLAGRVGDLVGRKRVFMLGLIVFTVASVLCGIAPSQGFLIGARFLQGIGAAFQASVEALSGYSTKETGRRLR